MYHIVACLDPKSRNIYLPQGNGKLINAIIQDDPKAGDTVTLVDLMNSGGIHEIYTTYNGRQGSHNKECHWKYYKYICTI